MLKWSLLENGEPYSQTIILNSVSICSFKSSRFFHVQPEFATNLNEAKNGANPQCQQVMHILVIT